MKNLALLITISFISMTTINAQVLGTLSTSVEGGVKGTTTTFSPMIELFSLEGANNTETLIFDAMAVNGTNEVTFTLSSDKDDEQFSNFVTTLTTSEEHLLRIGHNIEGIKSRSASPIQGWFGEDANFIGQEVTAIKVIYTNIQFDTVDNWTTFSYDMEVQIIGGTKTKLQVSRK